jgi:hypothetical protein
VAVSVVPSQHLHRHRLAALNGKHGKA